ncbi:MAG: isopropylmalate/homocitrate/citramalate synthase [Patiriisocius sp.]|jgi:isopropylmalate/homocitrate/citramalate synthase
MNTNELPTHIQITEEGPREGFQIEPGPIATADKVRLINALSETGLKSIQVCSFVSDRLVPGWADADEVVAALTKPASVDYTALWFNARGMHRALTHKDTLTLKGCIHTVASEAFCLSNLNRTLDENTTAMAAQTLAHQEHGSEVEKIMVMAAFGCNFSGDGSAAQTVRAVHSGMAIARDAEADITEIALADTMGWANPLLIERIVGAVREKWPGVTIKLHLHDTRGLGIANAYAGLGMGVTRFDTTVGGLGGCPFAAKRSSSADAINKSLPPGNIATEELVLLASELGIETGVDIDALIEVGKMAESIVGHSLPSATLRGGSLNSYRNTLSA